MRRKYTKYKLGRLIGAIVMVFGLLMLAGADGAGDVKQMTVCITMDLLVIAVGVLFYELCKYKELYRRAKEKRAQERELHIGA